MTQLKSAMCNKLVVIAGRLFPPEGELLRVQLAVHGIRSWLENAELLTWFWHWCNATGGVKLLVQSDDCQQACDILNSTPESVAVDEPPRQPCQKCNEPFPPAWHLCWKCGTAADGTEDPEFFFDDVLPIDSLWRLRKVPAIGALLLIFVALVIFIPPLFLLFVLYWIFSPGRLIQDLERESEMEGESSRQSLFPDAFDSDEPFDDRTESGDQLCIRALRSVVFCVYFMFPLSFPWVIYSLWILIRIDLHETPVSDSGRRSYYLAWACFTLYAVVVAALIAVLVLEF